MCEVCHRLDTGSVNYVDKEYVTGSELERYHMCSPLSDDECGNVICDSCFHKTHRNFGTWSCHLHFEYVGSRL